MESNDFINLWIKTREAWASGKLSPISLKQRDIARENLQLPIEEFMGDLSAMQKQLEFVPPLNDEFIYGFNDDQSLDVLLTNFRLIIRNKKSRSLDIYALEDLAACLEHGWWTKTIKVILKDGTNYIYKGLGGSIRLEYIMYAISNAKKKVKKTSVHTPYDGSEDFVFISYLKNDFNKIKPYLDFFDEKGINYWYDKGIPGGAEWHNVIETKIQSCYRVITFLSKEAVESKWVNREIKYADIKNIPITPIKMDELDLKYGLDLILMQYQLMDINSSNFFSDILKSIK